MSAVRGGRAYGRYYLWGSWAAGWAMLPCNTKIAWAERASVGERALRSEFGRLQVQEASSSRQQ